MSLLVTVGVDNSVVPAGTRFNVIATFVNQDGSDHTIAGVTRYAPTPSTGLSDQGSIVGTVIPAGKTLQVQWGELLPQSSIDWVYDIKVQFQIEDGSFISPTQNPSVEVLAPPPTGGPQAVNTAALPGDGSLWFDSNVQSGLLGAIV